jgi:hypothetical protein
VVVEVDRITPGRAVPVGEVGAVTREVIAGRTEVVVDDVHDQAETARVTGGDESLETVGATVRVMGGVDVDAVVSPTALPGELVGR